MLHTGKPEAIEMAQRLNAYFVRLRTINRRMMAAVSELALTQATGIKLTEEKTSIEAELRAAIRRMEVSNSPSALHSAELTCPRCAVLHECQGYMRGKLHIAAPSPYSPSMQQA